MEAISILVVDDKQENLLAARNQFAGKNVNLLCCSLFSVAVKLLREKNLIFF